MQNSGSSVFDTFAYAGADGDGRDHPNHEVLKRNNVRVIGEGKTPIILCHGFGCNQQIWHYLATPLAARHQLILFDHVGAGESDVSAYDSKKYSTLGGYAQDIVEICQVLKLQEVVIVGHSVGAMIAMLAAIQAPEQFSKVIMLAPSPCYVNEPGYYGGFDQEDVQQLLQLMEADYTGWAYMFAGLLMGPDNHSLGEELAKYFCDTDSTIAKHFARVAFLSDNRSEVPQLLTNTLLLQCQQDAVAPEEVGAYLLEHLHEAKLVQLQTTGHCPHLSAPLETLAAIEAFLAA
ncbi:alpha/beta hydrolase [Hymenobacter sp. GOD-10R]|uniref:alpha/beta fold hydrolase n=1 Tax=Hymenobacter sp. GOD-10R TaxID=3093922 RepID=UPI002D778665|nr:alpha/beta hydrolase [Hymenobacter sp. GOD-10R]WRQ27755.1 alpha/beta hydrolase [Hymenobacter sp. GOD-10R]